MADESVKPLPFFFVGEKITQERVSTFLNTKHKLLSEAIGKTDTKAVWYSREHIEGLLGEMNHANADGLRIYFGTYSPQHETFGSQLCLLMVMTQQNPANGAQRDISIEDAEDFALRSETERAFEPGTEKDFNVGSPCPPICGGHEMKYQG
jgi:hypothetical protein